MRHGHDAPLSADPWTIGVIVVALLALVALIGWLIHRRSIVSDGLTPVERKTLPYEEREILSMLRQNGGPLPQKDIVDALPGDLEDVAEVLKNMEDKGVIRREWQPDQNTYMVSTRT